MEEHLYPRLKSQQPWMSASHSQYIVLFILAQVYFLKLVIEGMFSNHTGEGQKVVF